MPYSSMEAAKAAGAKTELGGATLTLAQVNAIAAAADALKREGNVESPYAVATSQFKKGHKIEDGKWVKKKGGTRDLEADERVLFDEILDGLKHGGARKVVVLESPPPGTRTVPDVELLKEGVHVDRHGHTLVVSPAKIKQIPAIYRKLVSLGFRPPVRLTHNPDHPMASGFPSLGWPDVPRAYLDPVDNKWTLTSDLLGVPVQFADIMEAGGYDRVSSGLYEDVKVGDFHAPLAIDHVAVLGVTHPAVTEMRGISGVHKLYENEMADRDGVEVAASYLFEDGGLVSERVEEEGGLMPPLTKEQLAEYGCTTDEELKAKLARIDTAEKDSKDKTVELEAARSKIRLGAAEGFIATNREKFPPALDDHVRAVHMALTDRNGAAVEFARAGTDGSVQTVTLDPVGSLTAIVAKFGKAIELQDENAPEGGKDQEHMTEEEKKVAAEAAEKKKKEDEAKAAEEGGDEKKEGETDEVVELARGDGFVGRSQMAREQTKLARLIAERDGVNMGHAMGSAAIELARAGWGTDAYVPPEGLEEPKKDDKK